MLVRCKARASMASRRLSVLSADLELLDLGTLYHVYAVLFQPGGISYYISIIHLGEPVCIYPYSSDLFDIEDGSAIGMVFNDQVDSDEVCMICAPEFWASDLDYYENLIDLNPKSADCLIDLRYELVARYAGRSVQL